jgi:two-component system, sensor histidine kinase PdtaS
VIIGLFIEVKATSVSATPSEAVNFGLIVTELVINALKQGLPEGDEGEILVSYDAEHSGWRLSVADNGSGAKEATNTDEPPHIGLGTSIVEALAHQVEAMVHKTGRPQGNR